MSAIPTSNDYYTPIYGAEALANEYLNRASQMARSTTVSVPNYTVSYSNYYPQWCDETPSFTISIDNGDVRFGGVRLEDIFETVPIKSDQKRDQEMKEALDALDSLLDEEVNKE